MSRGLIGARIPALDPLRRAIERRMLRRLDRRARAGRLGDDAWRSPARLWPDFGDD